MHLLKWIVGGLIALAAVVIGGGWLISPTFVVTRSVVIQAPPERIYGLIADPRAWASWSVWNRRDPAMQMQYRGPRSGNGAQWSWQSKTEGDGSMTFVQVVPNQRVGYELFFPDFGTMSTGALELAAQDGATRVTWTMNGDMGSRPLYRWMALMADRMIGKDFDAGLANLKAVAEGRPAS